MVALLAEDLRRRGFRVFVDTGDIDPGDNFVRRLSGELRRATAVLAVVSPQYPSSRWAQAELYHSVVLRKLDNPHRSAPAVLTGLDPPLERATW
jgi:TIR domain